MNRAESNRLRCRAHSVVCRAKNAGLLPRFDSTVLCVDCGVQATEYDHRDYFKPLDVVPVCHPCNIKRGPAYPFTVESPNDPLLDGEPMIANLNWEYDGLTQRLVEVPCASRYWRKRDAKLHAEMFL